MNKLMLVLILSNGLLFAQAPSVKTLYQLSDAKTRSISPENFTGEKGKGGMATLEEGSAAKAARKLGQGWKVNPYIHIQPGETFVRTPTNYKLQTQSRSAISNKREGEEVILLHFIIII